MEYFWFEFSRIYSTFGLSGRHHICNVSVTAKHCVWVIFMPRHLFWIWPQWPNRQSNLLISINVLMLFCVLRAGQWAVKEQKISWLLLWCLFQLVGNAQRSVFTLHFVLNWLSDINIRPLAAIKLYILGVISSSWLVFTTNKQNRNPSLFPIKHKKPLECK